MYSFVFLIFVRISLLAVIKYGCAFSNETTCSKVDFLHIIFETFKCGACSGVERCCGLYFSKAYFGVSPKMKFKFEDWSLAENQILSLHFPIDKEAQNYVGEVREAVFSFVMPRPLRYNPTLAAASNDVLSEILDFDLSVKKDPEFLNFVSGNKVLKDSVPLAHRYGGHQFGYWAGQLGDGRAHLLGEYVNSLGERWELQLKGSGKTPYSRKGDGYAVIRSSVREFLCSEAMYYLGVPTSRAATLVISDDPVWRDQFYNGNFIKERAAVVLRLAKSWFRYGSLEILTANNEPKLLRDLVDFIIEQHFRHIDKSDPNKYLAFFSQVVENTAQLIAQWQSIGFTHGVCNTDNFSILSITIDYGPFGFMDEYNPDFVPNTSDDEKRYSYEKQPDVGYFNLNKLRLALNPLLTSTQQEVMNVVLSGYFELYKKNFMEIFRTKLGLVGISESDEEIVAYLLHMMEDTKADFTMTFRNLGDWSFNDILKGHVSDHLWSLKLISSHTEFNYWRNLLELRLREKNVSDLIRREHMHRVNPRYILRNWIAETAIKDTEKDSFDKLIKIHKILKNPFVKQEEGEQMGFAEPPPSWAKRIKVSCSS